MKLKMVDGRRKVKLQRSGLSIKIKTINDDTMRVEQSCDTFASNCRRAWHYVAATELKSDRGPRCMCNACACTRCMARRGFTTKYLTITYFTLKFKLTGHSVPTIKNISSSVNGTLLPRDIHRNSIFRRK